MGISSLTTQTKSFSDILNLVTKNLALKDQIHIISDITWSQYETITEQFSDRSHYRTSYLDRTIQIMSPGRNHEKVKEYLSSLLETYFQEAEIDYYPLGSTTFKIEPMQAGKEPDFCYCLETEKEFPDLAVEVIFSSGGIDVLEIYKRLQIKEVWLWQNEELKIYYLKENEYIVVSSSQLLPKLDIKLLMGYVSQSNLRIAIKEFRQKLQATQ